MSHILREPHIRFDLFKELATQSPFNDQIVIFAVFPGFKELDDIGVIKVLVDKDFLLDIVVGAGFCLGAGNGLDGYFLSSTLINCLPNPKIN